MISTYNGCPWLDWTIACSYFPFPDRPRRDPSVKADSGFFGALETVGLKLQPASHSFDTLVVDHAGAHPIGELIGFSRVDIPVGPSTCCPATQFIWVKTDPRRARMEGCCASGSTILKADPIKCLKEFDGRNRFAASALRSISVGACNASARFFNLVRTRDISCLMPL